MNARLNARETVSALDRGLALLQCFDAERRRLTPTESAHTMSHGPAQTSSCRQAFMPEIGASTPDGSP